jgi:hypothetical protein
MTTDIELLRHFRKLAEPDKPGEDLIGGDPTQRAMAYALLRLAMAVDKIGTNLDDIRYWVEHSAKT